MATRRTRKSDQHRSSPSLDVKKDKNKIHEEGFWDDEISVWCPKPYTIFKLLLSARFCSAFLSNISDCDETFNYWEPTHYLLYGTGFQTWEYSPQYAIRSYGYLLLNALPGFAQVLVFKANKVLVFYFLRFILSIMCAASEAYFYSYKVIRAPAQIKLAIRNLTKKIGTHVRQVMPSQAFFYGKQNENKPYFIHLFELKTLGWLSLDNKQINVIL